MAKILFINPTVRHHDKPRHVPYGMAILVQQAIDAGHAVQVYDENAWRPEDPERTLKDVLRADDWQVIATGGLITTYSALRRVLVTARRECPNALIVAGGGFFTSMGRDMMTMRPEIDIGVVGEAYVTFLDILRRHDENDREWSRCAGIFYRDAAGGVHLTPPRALISAEDLDRLPYPAYHLFPMDRYWVNSDVLLSEAAMSARRRIDINASYGCSLICRFCWHLGLHGDTHTMPTAEGADIFFTYDRNLRWHSPEYVVKMVRHFRDTMGIDFVAFLDENLMTMHRASRGRWLPEICRLWIEYGLQPECIRKGIPHDPETCHGVHWSGTSHAGQVDQDILRVMYQAGCSHLDYGLESFNRRVLKNVGKGVTPERNVAALKMTLDAGIRPVPNQIIGFPDEFFDSINDSMSAWEKLGIVCHPFIATAYPGSEWFTVYRDRILEQYDGDLEAFISDLDDATKVTAVISENFSAVELLGIRELMVTFNRRKLAEFEKQWWAKNPVAKFPIFNSGGWRERAADVRDGRRNHPFSYELVEIDRGEFERRGRRVD